MFEPSDQPRVFGLGPGADFPRAFADGLIRRLANHPPDLAARTTVFVNTRRMQDAVRNALMENGARFLPQLHLVTDLANDPLPGIRPAVPKLRRILEVMRLVEALIARQPGIAPATAAFGLAEDLVALLAEMQDEGVSPDRLEDLALAEDHAEHWQRSLQFLRIATGFTGADAAADGGGRQQIAVARLIADWQANIPSAPVIVAGSTGSRGTTMRLMLAVAALPQGAVVLPGYDYDLPPQVWSTLSDTDPAAEDHPQYRFAALRRAMGPVVMDIPVWSDAFAAPDPSRNRLISLALRPAPMTDDWLRDGPDLGDARTATHGLSLIEARGPVEEAQAIALCLRKAAGEGRKAALITPDRTLARRVSAILDRWGIIPDDSAGEPLSQTPPGRFLRHVAGLFGTPLTSEALLIVLKHPMTASAAGERGPHLLRTRDLELSLRRHGPAFPTADDVRTWGDIQGEGGWANWVADGLDAAPTRPDLPLSAWTETLMRMADRFASGPGATGQHGLWDGKAGTALRRAMDELAAEATVGGIQPAPVFQTLLLAHLSAVPVRETVAADPRVSIWGTLESRVQGADLVVLAGLNEGTWPERPPPDPWMSRQMRRRVGLLLPERRIGLSAHDFQQAVCGADVVLSRSVRDSGTDTVPSRWLLRLTNLLPGLTEGKDALDSMRQRGRVWTDLAQALDRPPGNPRPARRPAPRPPVHVRPTQLSVTQIRTLIRDPYAIYAEKVLRLRPLDPLRAEPEPRLRGRVLHRVVQDLLSQPDMRSDLSGLRRRLLSETARRLNEDVPWPVERRFWMLRMEAFAGPFLTNELRRSAEGEPLFLERDGSLEVPDDFVLTGRPDRIDRMTDGRLHILDYKTGGLPSATAMFEDERQLPLEAIMAEAGAFGGLRADVGRLTYVHIAADGQERQVALEDGQLADVWDDLIRLTEDYRDPGTGYVARAKWKDTRYEGSYDHLARFGEWQLHDNADAGDVGGGGGA